MTKLLIGVDPGKAGAICFYTVDRNHYEFIDMEQFFSGDFGKRINLRKLSDVISEKLDGYHPDHVQIAIERVKGWGKEKDGKLEAALSNMFNFGFTAAAIESAFIFKGFTNVFLYDVMSWKSKLPIEKKSDKDAVRAYASGLCPEIAPYFQRKKDHDRAEAFLIMKHHAKQFKVGG
jgi:hypothetical protein